MKKIIETLLLNPNVRANICENLVKSDEIFQPWGGE